MPRDFVQLAWNTAIEDDLRQIVRLAVREDLDRFHDWTTLAIVGPDQQGRAAVVVRKPGVVAGLRALPIVIDEMHAAIDIEFSAADGDDVAAGTIVAELAGSARDLLVCERPLLNLLGHLSGIATRTREFVRQIAGTKAKIYDTRKTTPGWRRLDKYAVRCGGGMNHRTGLFDAVLIKDNHLALAAGEKITPADAVRRSRDFLNQTAAQRDDASLLVEIEIDKLDQLDAVLAAGPDIVLLDNMRLDTLREAVARRNALAPSIELEASGGVNLSTVRAIAETGVERISVGEITHSAPALDVALDWLPKNSRG
ncbi:MAG: carboxylating nicotinate-nucleotide diphosphorylase [Pirellulales bacterium]